MSIRGLFWPGQMFLTPTVIISWESGFEIVIAWLFVSLEIEING